MEDGTQVALNTIFVICLIGGLVSTVSALVNWTDLKDLSKNNPVKNSYEDGICPDCGKPIPNNVSDGESCSNCEHLFYKID